MALLLRSLPRLSILTISVLLFSLLLALFNSIQIHELRVILGSALTRREESPSHDIEKVCREPVDARIAWVDGHGSRPDETYMRHIFEAFRNFGYKIVNSRQSWPTEWDILWLHEYPFSESSPYKAVVDAASWPQAINHVPGSGFYTSKVELATAKVSAGMPLAFRLPKEEEALKKYAEAHPSVMWVQKDNSHRNIKIKALDEIDFKQQNSFVQKFVDNPLLIDNRKFDIGVYTVIISLDPLRVYTFSGDVIIRFCPKDYDPLDVKDVDKYVVGDDYTPIWEIASLDALYNKRRLSFKETLHEFLQQKGKQPSKIWQQIDTIIAEVFHSQQQRMLAARPLSASDPKFFELSRFDFVVDDELNVFLMEANMSPNLSSGHFKPNQLLYEQVLMSILSLVGAATPLTKKAEWDFRKRPRSSFPLGSDRDLRVPLPFCGGESCKNCDEKEECVLCGECLSRDEAVTDMLGELFRQHLQRRLMKRIPLLHASFPPLTPMDRLQKIWLEAKCKQDSSWC